MVAPRADSLLSIKIFCFQVNTALRGPRARLPQTRGPLQGHHQRCQSWPLQDQPLARRKRYAALQPQHREAHCGPQLGRRQPDSASRTRRGRSKPWKVPIRVRNKGVSRAHPCELVDHLLIIWETEILSPTGSGAARALLGRLRSGNSWLRGSRRSSPGVLLRP